MELDNLALESVLDARRKAVQTSIRQISGTGKNLGALTEIPSLWFAGALRPTGGNMRRNIVVECVHEDGNQATIRLGTIERLAGSTTAENLGVNLQESKQIVEPFARRRSGAASPFGPGDRSRCGF
jgi:hypothetical protein